MISNKKELSVAKELKCLLKKIITDVLLVQACIIIPSKPSASKSNEQHRLQSDLNAIKCSSVESFHSIGHSMKLSNLNIYCVHLRSSYHVPWQHHNSPHTSSRDLSVVGWLMSNVELRNVTTTWPTVWPWHNRCQYRTPNISRGPTKLVEHLCSGTPRLSPSPPPPRWWVRTQPCVQSRVCSTSPTAGGRWTTSWCTTSAGQPLSDRPAALRLTASPSSPMATSRPRGRRGRCVWSWVPTRPTPGTETRFWSDRSLRPSCWTLGWRLRETARWDGLRACARAYLYLWGVHVFTSVQGFSRASLRLCRFWETIDSGDVTRSHATRYSNVTMFLVKVKSCRVVVCYPSGLDTRLEAIHGDRQDTNHMRSTVRNDCQLMSTRKPPGLSTEINQKTLKGQIAPTNAFFWLWLHLWKWDERDFFSTFNLWKGVPLEGHTRFQLEVKSSWTDDVQLEGLKRFIQERSQSVEFVEKRRAVLAHYSVFHRASLFILGK